MAATQMSHARTEALLRKQRADQEAKEGHPPGSPNRLDRSSEHAIGAKQQEDRPGHEKPGPAPQPERSDVRKHLGIPLRELLPYEEYEEIPFTD